MGSKKARDASPNRLRRGMLAVGEELIAAIDREHELSERRSQCPDDAAIRQAWWESCQTVDALAKKIY